MLPLLKKVAIQNTDTPSTIAILSNIMEGVDGSGAFNLTNEVTDIKIEDNQTRQTRQTHALDIRAIFDETEAAKVAAMQAAGTPALITGLTPDGVVLFGKPVQITRGKVYDEVTADKYIASLAAPSGYQGEAPNKRTGVYVGKNLLGLYDVTSGGAEFLNGFFAGDISATYSVSGNVQTVTTGAFVSNNIYTQVQKFFLPFVGLSITASCDFTDRTGANSDSARVALKFLDASDTQIGSVVFSTQTSTGINSISAQIPANTAFVQFLIFRSGTGSSMNFSFRNPMLTIDGSTQFQL